MMSTFMIRQTAAEDAQSNRHAVPASVKAWTTQAMARQASHRSDFMKEATLVDVPHVVLVDEAPAAGQRLTLGHAWPRDAVQAISNQRSTLFLTMPCARKRLGPWPSSAPLTRQTDASSDHCGSGASPAVETGRTASECDSWPGIFCPLGVFNSPWYSALGSCRSSPGMLVWYLPAVEALSGPNSAPIRASTASAPRFAPCLPR